MNFWIYFWSIVFGVGLTIFAGLSITVAIGGFYDIRSLFKSLNSQHRQKNNDDTSDATSRGIGDNK